jgi:hypothetical protein
LQHHGRTSTAGHAAAEIAMRPDSNIRSDAIVQAEAICSGA